MLRLFFNLCGKLSKWLWCWHEERSFSSQSRPTTPGSHNPLLAACLQTCQGLFYKHENMADNRAALLKTGPQRHSADQRGHTRPYVLIRVSRAPFPQCKQGGKSPMFCKCHIAAWWAIKTELAGISLTLNHPTFFRLCFSPKCSRFASEMSTRAGLVNYSQVVRFEGVFWYN